MVANEWKDANDKVMPVRQWLEERRFMQVSGCTWFFFLYMCILYPSVMSSHSYFFKYLVLGPSGSLLVMA